MARNPPSTPKSPTSAGFNTYQLRYDNRTSENYSNYDDDEAAVDPNIIKDKLEEGDEDEAEGEDFFNDNHIKDYSRMDDVTPGF
ncbi:hypothetical protein L2E82_14377 [Cichorium intybus]|uniref:Uncharacterized protein n=1 Tax=Cichorium intybus TaxID=13427 RepID=A0ACB9EZX5_CICIN|nr:hypothetical protein L2E82_14377 [Cichorium intybus]